MFRLNINKPVEQDNHVLPPNFGFPVYEAEEEEDKEILDEIARVLEYERKTICNAHF